MKIHVSGGEGYIGRAVSERLLINNDVTTSDKDTVDVLDLDRLEVTFRNEQPDVIIALAGIMGAQVSKNNLFETFQVNSIGILNVLEAMRRVKVNNLIFFSSQTVYGSAEEEKPSDEKTIYNPMHPYASSKVISEYFIQEYCRNFGINAIILQPSIVVGNFYGEPNSVNEFIQSALNDETIVIFGEGKHKREYISLNDMVCAVNQSVNFLKNNTEDGIFEKVIISSDQPISMVELAEKSVSLANQGRIEHIDKTSRAFSLCSDSLKSKNLINWEVKDNLDDILMTVMEELK